MTICIVNCEYDMGWNNGDYQGIFSSKEKAIDYLEKQDWDECGYSSYEDIMEDKLLSIYEMEID